MNISRIPIFVFIFIILFTRCEEQSEFDWPQFDVQAAPEWDSLFKRSSGWFGGDGIFAIPLTGREHRKASAKDSTIILFSDTMIGQIKGDSLQPGYHMVHNSIANLIGGDPIEKNVSFHIRQDAEGRNKTLFSPNIDGATDMQYYWLGDGFLNLSTKKTHIFAYLVEDHPEYELFTFDVEGAALITIPEGDVFPFPNSYQTRLPFFFKHDKQKFGSFGAGILVNTTAAGAPNPDGFIYIYGVNDPNKQLLVCRVPSALFEDFSSWTFWDGATWNSDFKKSAAITQNVSNELSVSFLPDGRLLLVSQVGNLDKSSVGIRISQHFEGPFSPMREIWNCEEAMLEPEFIAYNAKAHPSLSAPGEILISYNVNSMAFWDQIEDHPHLYRPRFIKMILK